jgi:hypothetical protein
MTCLTKIALFLGLLTIPMYLLVSEPVIGADITWQELETKYTIIHYQSMEDLVAFDKKLKYSSLSSATGLQWLFSGSDSGNDPIERFKDKVDALYRRVQEILGMRKRMKKVEIEIYRDNRQLKEAFQTIYKREGHYRAWYIFELNTIYLTVDDIHEGILAHEMAHSIIDHYLTVRPPARSAEILARYVDAHLHE